MTAITASVIKELREATGAGMMDCKKALNETGGDFEKAVDWLREKGIAKAAKKSSRAAAEGLVALAVEGTKGAVIELNAETDFVGKNPEFQALCDEVAALALKEGGDVAALNNATLASSGKPVSQTVEELVGKIGENMSLRRSETLEVSEGAIVSYIHNKVTETTGRIGVLVALESSGDAAKLQEIGKQVAMHIAAIKPEALTEDELDEAIVERERKVFSEQAKASGKPDNIIEKMVEGRIRKFYEEVVLLKQAFVMDNKQSVSEAVDAAAKELGTSIKITGFTRLALGEGVEVEEEDFAAEVAKTAASA